jgi:tRNA A37 methylthiotransferase MiaB
MADDVPEEEKKERNQRLLRRVEEVALSRMQAWLGREVDVLLEEVSPRRAGVLLGRSRHGLPVSVAGGEELLGREVRAAVDHATGFGLAARGAAAAV